MVNQYLNFVLSPSFHGATLLAILLNNHTKIVSLGDAYPSEDFVQTCSCGKKVTKCEFWTSLKAKLSDRGDHSHASYLPRLEIGRSTQVTALAGLLMGEAVSRLGFGDYLEQYQRFLHAVLKLNRKSIFVDGQKSITKVVALRGLLGKKGRVRVIHLTRDPRGYYNSCKKHMPGVDVEQVAAMWNYHRWLAMFKMRFLQCDYYLLRYEDLCHAPVETMNDLFAFLGLPGEDVVRKPDNPEQYHLMGNKMLMKFDGEVRLDTGWETGLTVEQQRKIMKMTKPLREQFNYYD